MESGPYINNKNLWQQIHRSPLFDISQFILLVGAILWFFSNSSAQMGYNWQRYQIPRYIFTHDEAGYYAGPLWDGLMVTFRISGISLLLAFMIWLSP